jgi:hypothetical protein
MAYATSAIVTRDLHDIQRTETKASQGFLRRLFEALVASRRRQAEREMAQYLAMRSFSDELERDIERRFL